MVAYSSFETNTFLLTVISVLACLMGWLGVGLQEDYQEATLQMAWSKTTDVFPCFLDRSNPVVEHFQEAIAKMITGRVDEG